MRKCLLSGLLLTLGLSSVALAVTQPQCPVLNGVSNGEIKSAGATWAVTSSKSTGFLGVADTTNVDGVPTAVLENGKPAVICNFLHQPTQMIGMMAL